MASRKPRKVPRTPSQIRRELELQQPDTGHYVRAIVGALLLLAERWESFAVALDGATFLQVHEQLKRGTEVVSCMSCGLIYASAELKPAGKRSGLPPAVLATTFVCKDADCGGWCVPYGGRDPGAS